MSTARLRIYERQARGVELIEEAVVVSSFSCDPTEFGSGFYIFQKCFEALFDKFNWVRSLFKTKSRLRVEGELRDRVWDLEQVS